MCDLTSPGIEPQTSRANSDVTSELIVRFNIAGFPCNGEPDPPQNGSVRCSFGSYQKSVCHFSCAPGFALPPSSKYPVTCLPKQEYNGTSPSCMSEYPLESPHATSSDLYFIGITCQPPLSTPAHGQLSCTDHSYAESVCQVTCDHDYELTGRDSRIVCGGNGDWSSITPTCKRKLSQVSQV